jgi:hypothetical protein
LDIHYRNLIVFAERKSHGYANNGEDLYPRTLYSLCR